MDLIPPSPTGDQLVPLSVAFNEFVEMHTEYGIEDLSQAMHQLFDEYREEFGSSPKVLETACQELQQRTETLSELQKLVVSSIAGEARIEFEARGKSNPFAKHNHY